MPPEEINDRSPLFAQRDRTFSKLNGRDLSRIVKRLAEKAGAPTCTAHSIRKLFQTSLEEAGVPANWVMVMMAHKLGGSEGYYSLPSKQQLREAYQRAYAYLAVTREDTEKIVQERLKEIEAEYREKYEGLRKKLEQKLEEEPEWMKEFRQGMKTLKEVAEEQDWKGHFKELGRKATQKS
jgi:soluble cytochrome b562